MSFIVYSKTLEKERFGVPSGHQERCSLSEFFSGSIPGRNKPLKRNENHLDENAPLPIVAKANPIMFSPPSVNGTPERWPALKPAAPLKSDASRDDSVRAHLPLTSFGV